MALEGEETLGGVESEEVEGGDGGDRGHEQGGCDCTEQTSSYLVAESGELIAELGPLERVGPCHGQERGFSGGCGGGQAEVGHHLLRKKPRH